MKIPAALIAATLACCLPAQAQTLPAASIVVGCTRNDGSQISGPSSCAVDGSVASVTTAPFVELSASAAYTALASGSASGFAALTYSFAVLGGVPNTIVPVDIDFVLRGTNLSLGPSSVYSFAEILANSSVGTGYAVICTGCADSSSDRRGTLHFNVLAGDIHNTIGLEVEALAGGYADILANSSSAFAGDTRIYFDSALTDPGDYTIAISDGVGNGLVSPVPEPSNVALMLTGLSIVSWSAKRRSQKTGNFSTD